MVLDREIARPEALGPVLTSSAPGPHLKDYLVHFGTNNTDFRLPEVEALCELFGLRFEVDKAKYSLLAPFVIVKLENDEAVRKICSRAVGIREVCELWAQGPDHQALNDAIKAFSVANKETYADCVANPESSFKFVIEGYGHKILREHEKEIFARFAWMNWKGKVLMKGCRHKFRVFFDFHNPANDTHLVNPDLQHIYFGREVSEAQRHLIDQYTLKKRKYLGTTSMESEVSFFSANMGLVKPGSLVLDPFVGTGSLLVSAAHYGATVIGADLDMRVLKAMGKETNISDNFEQYGLQHLLGDLVRIDSSQHKVLCTRPFFDAIICDPPYGIRAGARKTGAKASKSGAATDPAPVYTPEPSPRPVVEKTRTNEMPHPDSFGPTVVYNVPELLGDLYDMAARILVVGGRLVFWLPTLYTFTVDQLPSHPCFKLVAHSNQPLSTTYCRRLLTLVKTRPFDPSLPFERTPMAYNVEDLAYNGIGDKLRARPQVHIDVDPNDPRASQKRANAKRKQVQDHKKELFRGRSPIETEGTQPPSGSADPPQPSSE